MVVGPPAFVLFVPAVDLHLLRGTSAAWGAGDPKGQAGPTRDGACCSCPGSRFASLTSPEEPAGVNYSLPFPPRASAHRELQFADCLLRGRKGQEPHKQGEKQSGAARPPGLLIPPDIRALMNVLSWSREYCRRLSPPASPAFARPRSYQGYLT